MTAHQKRPSAIPSWKYPRASEFPPSVLPNLVCRSSNRSFTHDEIRRPIPPTPTTGTMTERNREIQAIFGRSNHRRNHSNIPLPRRYGSGEHSTGPSVRKTSQDPNTADALWSPAKARRYTVVESYSSSVETGDADHNEFDRTPTKHYTPKIGLTKSQTTPALLSPHREVVSRSLLRAVEPAIPRSETLNDLLSPVRARRAIVQHERERAEDERNMHESLSKSEDITKKSCSISDETVIHTAKDEHDEEEDDPRYVYTQQQPMYWLGRYTAMSDNIHTAQLTTSHTGKSRSNREEAYKHGNKSSSDFDRTQAQIHMETVDILLSFCRTEPAVKSLKQFVRQVYGGKMNIGSFGDKLSNFRFPRPGKSYTHTRSRFDHPVNQAKPKVRNFSSRLPSTTFRKTSSDPPYSGPELGMRKSYTTNNLHESVYERLNPSQDAGSSQRHRYVNRRQSEFASRRSTHDRPSEPVQGIERRPPFNRPPLPKSMSEYNLIRDRVGNDNIEPTAIKDRPPRIQLNSAPTRSQDCISSPSSDGYPSKSQTTGSSYSQESFVSLGEKSRSKFRKSESMMKLVDAGLTQFKRIGHRVSNASMS